MALFSDQAAYGKIFDHYYHGLFNLAYTFIKDEPLAEEIVSDAFMALWKQRERLLQIENLKVYLYVAVKNLSIRYCSKQVNDWNWSNLHMPSAADTSLSPEDLMISKDTMDNIQQAIEKLPPRCKLIFKLVREDGLKYKEIAELLNVSVKTVEAQVTIAGKRIAASLNLTIKK